MVPLDATGKVPIDVAFLNEFKAGAKGKLGKFVAQILETEREFIQAGFFQAWDPLAAVALVAPDVATWTPMTIKVEADGSTVREEGKAWNARVAMDADAARFKKIFLSAFRGR